MPKTNNSSKEDEAKLLGFFLQYHMEERTEITFEIAAVDLDCHKSNNRWRAVWKSLKEQELIEAVTSGKGFHITQKGIDSAATDEYKEFVKDMNFVAATNQEHQERLKKRFKRKKASLLFDLLLKYGSLTRYELAGLAGEKDRSHNFSYSLQELRKQKKLVEVDPNSKGSKGKKLRLSDKAFLTPGDRPEPELLEDKVLEKAVKDNAAPRKKRKQGDTTDESSSKESKSTSSKKTKKPERKTSKKADSKPATLDQEDPCVKEDVGSNKTAMAPIMEE